MARHTRLIGSVFVVTMLAFSAGCGGGGQTVLSPEAFAGDTCGDLTTWGNSVTATFAGFADLSSVDFTDKTAAKKVLGDLSSALGDANTATTKLIDSINKRGAPNVKDGAALKQKLVTAFTKFRDVLGGARTKINNFNVDTADDSDASKFQDDLSGLDGDITAAFSGLDDVEKDPGLKAAFDKDATCKNFASAFAGGSSS
jgi:hypothetical protein